MADYNIEARYLLQHNLRQFNESLIQNLWVLFTKIALHWGATQDMSHMRSNFLVFLSNRIEINTNYLAEYINAIDVIKELTVELGEDKAYEKLFTDPAANITPPFTSLARVRQYVSNEFIILYLSLGGFKEFGSGLINYPGYICGPNLPDSTPYRTSQEGL